MRIFILKKNTNILMNLELKKFDLSNIKKDKVCVFIGKRETGKSFLVRDLLYYHQDIPWNSNIRN